MSDPKQTEQAFLQRVKSGLDEHEAQLDADTLRDLRLARHKALESLHKPRRLWQPVGLAALAATVAVVVVSLHVLQPTTPNTAPGMDDMALLSAGDDFDLYENLDFYQWLELEKHNG
jgi:ferric-dicitrate binding protein FerR (iron transport regulator)